MKLFGSGFKKEEEYLVFVCIHIKIGLTFVMVEFYDYIYIVIYIFFPCV